MHITEIRIKSLWNKFDFHWQPNAQVNVLSGKNGSGKSTIISILHAALKDSISDSTRFLKDALRRKRSEKGEVFIAFDSGEQLHCNWGGAVLSRQPNINKPALKFCLIDTFDAPLPEKVYAPEKYKNAELSSTLDYEIEEISKTYLKYQLDLFKRITNEKQDPDTVNANHLRFKEIINTLFSGTGKQLYTEDNDIKFLCGETVLSPYQLSSGEKQMLYILLQALIQDQQPAIFFMDEPEISLHFDWQKKLIGFVRELNPNAQIFVATHSPAIIIEGWTDCVFDMQDLLSPTKIDSPAP